MENKIIKIHEDNLSIFNEKLKELNEKFSKKGLPLINKETLQLMDKNKRR